VVIDEKKLLSKIVIVLSGIMLLIGLIAMGICFMFVWSNNQLDIIGAGMGFITGSIMIGTSLIALSNLSHKT
jgi:hypothetical protein